MAQEKEIKNFVFNYTDGTSKTVEKGFVLVKPFCNTLFDKYLPVTSLHWC